MLKLTRAPELSPVEVVILENIYLILNRLEVLTKQVYDSIDKYDLAVEAIREMKYLKYNGTLKLLKDQFFQHASPATLSKIINEEKFKPESTHLNEFLISKEVLKEFGYGSEIRSTDPKATLAKTLGAKIVV